MPNKRNDKHVNSNTNTIEQNITDAELDTMLAQWAEADAEALDVAIPEGFHQAVMVELRAIQEAPVAEPQTQKKGLLISLAERFANKKAWMGTAAAAALIICCLPILQSQQNPVINVADEQSPSNLRMIQQEVETDQTQTDVAPQIMMASLADEDAMAKSSAQESANIAYDGTTPEAQLTQLQAELEQLQTEITQLEAQIEEENTTE